MMSGFINTINGPTSTMNNMNSMIMHPPAIPVQNGMGTYATLPGVNPMPNGQPVSVQVARLGESLTPQYNTLQTPLEPFYGQRENTFPPARIGQTLPGSTILNLPPSQPNAYMVVPRPESELEPEIKKVQFDEKPSEIVPPVEEAKPAPEPVKEAKAPEKKTPTKTKDVRQRDASPKRRDSSPRRRSASPRRRSSSPKRRDSSNGKPKSIMKNSPDTNVKKPSTKKAPKIVDEPKANLIDSETGGECCGAPAKTCATLCAVLFAIALAIALIFLILFILAMVLGWGAGGQCDVNGAKDLIQQSGNQNGNPFPNARYLRRQEASGLFTTNYYLLEGETTHMPARSPSTYAALIWHCGATLQVVETVATSSGIQTQILLGDPIKDNNKRYTYFMRPGYRYTIKLEPSIGFFSSNKIAVVSIVAAQTGIVTFS